MFAILCAQHECESKSAFQLLLILLIGQRLDYRLNELDSFCSCCRIDGKRRRTGGCQFLIEEDDSTKCKSRRSNNDDGEEAAAIEMSES